MATTGQPVATTAAEVQEYLEAQNLEGRLTDALNSVVAERAPQGVSRLIEILSDQHNLIFAINGERFELPAGSVDPTVTLSDFLRTQTRWTGTKIGCGEGGCGAW